MQTTHARQQWRTILAALAFAAFGSMAALAATETVDGVKWNYIIEGNVATICGDDFQSAIPSATAGPVSVPATLGGHPVVCIGEYAFYMCESLTEVTIPEGVTDIGDKSFYCSGVTAVSIPGSVARIGAEAFGECFRLAELAIPDSVEEIGNWAFYSCENLSGVTLPSKLASIGQGTFSWCYALSQLTIPDSVASVGSGAFSDSGLAALSVPGWWEGRSMLDGADVPDGCTVTYRDTAGDPLAVATVALPPGTLWTPYSVTLEASGGTDPYTWSLDAGSELPGNLWLAVDGSGYIGGVASEAGEFTFTVIVEDAAGATASKELTLQIMDSWTPPQEETETVGGVTWSYTVSDGRATVTGADPAEGALSVPSTLGGHPVAAIGEYAFESRDAITGLSVPDGVEEIGDCAFTACGGLAKVAIGAGVSRIGREAFAYCYALPAFGVAAGNAAYAAVDGVLFDKAKTTLVQCPGAKAGAYAIPDGVEHIADGAFAGCAGLTRLAIPSSVADIGYGALTGCEALAAFEVAAGNASYASQDGVLFDKAKTVLVKCPAGKTGAYAIPDGVEDIGDGAFSGCEGLTGVAIPASVARIGGNAFSSCTGLRGVEIPDGVASIGEYAFGWCESLKEVSIGTGVRDIGDGAFSGCSGLAELALPDGVEHVGNWAFDSCSGLATLSVPASWEGTTMLDNAGVSEGCTVVYRAAPEEEVTTTDVPYAWLEENAADILAANGGDHEAAAKAPAANGKPVWECYVAGLSLTDADAAFKVKSISFVDGEPVIEWDPDLNEGKTKTERTYVEEGKASMADEWGPRDASSRFFRVRVVLPK